MSLKENDACFFISTYHLLAVARIYEIDVQQENVKVFLTFEQVFLEGNQVDIRDYLHHDHSIHVQQLPFYTIPTQRDGNELYESMKRLDSDLGFVFSNLDSLLEEAQLKKEQEQRQEQRRNEQNFSSIDELKKFGNHQKTQYMLNEIAFICGIQTWTATNDKNRHYKSHRLGAQDIDIFPQLRISADAQKRIQLIDTIWLKGNRPVCAFEVETSTPIFSGLLRLNELSSYLSTSELTSYIVAPQKRIPKYINEIKRPVFTKEFQENCYFISIETLEILFQKLKGLNGYVDFHVIETIRKNVTQLEQIYS